MRSKLKIIFTKLPALGIYFLFIFPLCADEAPVSLSLDNAIQLALKNHVDVKLAQARTEDARGKILLAASSILPQAIGSVLQYRTFMENLAAQGISFPGINPALGPFNTFDARIQLSQELLDMSAHQKVKSSRRLLEAALAREQLAKENVAAAAALSYVEALRAAKAKDEAQAGVDLAQKLQSQAGHQYKVGAAAGIDLARSETRAAEEDLRLLQAETSVQDAYTRLKRIVNIPLGRLIQLSDRLSFNQEEIISLDKAVSMALVKRAEIKIADEEYQSAEYALSASKWNRAPSLSLFGNYGLSGNNPDSSAIVTGAMGVSLNFPLFTSGRISGQTRESAARRDEAFAVLSDLRWKVEEDVRLAEDRIQISARRVQTSEQAVHLAEREMEMAHDRFSAGAGNNIEVISAQAALARVQDAYVAALADYSFARINLAMSLGEMASFKFTVLEGDKNDKDNPGKPH